MSAMMDRAERVEAARQWFDGDGGSSGLLSWEDVDLIVQLGISDQGAARNLLLAGPDALFSSWANLQGVIAAGGDIASTAQGAFSPSAEDRLKALTEWHTSALATGQDRDLGSLGAEDLSRIARSGAVTAGALKKLVALSARQVVRGHADEIAAVLSGLSVEALTSNRTTTVGVPDLKAKPATVAEPPPGVEPPPVVAPKPVGAPAAGDVEGPQASWTDFASFDYAAVAAESSAPQSISFTTTDDEQLKMTWSDVDTGPDVVLYRVKTSDEYPPEASTELGDLIAVTAQRSAVDARGFDAPVRYVAVWANRGRTEAEARLAQPTLVASDECVLPVRRCEVRVEDGGTVIGSWQPLNGVVRIDVLRLKSRVANQTSLYDPNYRLRPDQVGVGGFTDRDADPGEEYEYRVYVVAEVPGDGEEMSQPVMRRVRVLAIVEAVTDLRVAQSQDMKNSYELRWNMPPNGDVEIYRSEQPPDAGLGQNALSREAIVRAQLSAAHKLNYELVRVGGEGLMRDVTWPSEWAKAYFTPVTVLDEQQIRVGETRIMIRPRRVSGVRLIERVDSQFLTFAWPSGMTSVRIFMGPREADSFSPETQQPLMELSEDEYRKYGGAHLLNTLPTKGCAVHLVGMTYSRGRAELAEPVSVPYAGLARIDYRIVTSVTERGRLGRKGPTPPPRLMAKCDAPITRIPMVLMHHPSRLPLSLMDGRELKRRDVAFEVGGRTEIWPDMSDRPSSGFIRLFAEEPLNDGRPVAVLDPSIDQLRCG